MNLIPVLGTALWRASWQGALVVLLVLAVCRVFPKLPASARCWLWRLALGKFLVTLLLPVVVGVPLLLPLPASPHDAEAPAPAVTLPPDIAPALPAGMPPAPSVVSKGAEPVPAVHPALAITAPMTTASPVQPRVPLTLIWLPLWTLGVAACAVRLLRQGKSARRWRRNDCSPLNDPQAAADAAELAQRLGLPAAPPLLTAPELPLPLLIGGRRPAIVLPSAERLVEFGPEARRLMLAHEMAHLRRRDLWWSGMGAIVHALFFFHPLVWLARREEERAREMACDALAVAITEAPPARYGAMLLQIATLGRALSPLPAQALSILGGGSRREGEAARLKERLAALRDNTGRGPSRRKRVAIAVGIGVATLIALVPVRLIAQQQQQRSAKPRTALSGAVSGRVLTADGQPVAGATVSRLTAEGGRIFTAEATHTGADGSFALSAGRHVENSAPVVLLAVAPQNGLTLTYIAREESQPVTIRMRRPTALTVTFRNPDGSPAAAIPVRVSWLQGQRGDFPLEGLALGGVSVERPVLQGKTGPDGAVRFTGLPQGDRIRLDIGRTTGYARFSSNDMVTLEKGKTEQAQTISLVKAGTITGRLTFGGANRPAVGINVFAEYQEPARRPGSGYGILDYAGAAATSGPDGRYVIQGLRPGPHRLKVVTWDKPWATRSGGIVTIIPGATLANRDFVMTPAVLVTGRVTDAQSGDPVRNIWVGGGYAEEGPNWYSFYGVTDAEGRYRVRVPVGKAMLQLRPGVRGGSSASSGIKNPSGELYRRLLNAQAGKTYQVNFTLPREDQENQGSPAGAPAPVRGVVVGPDGRRPVAKAEVFLFGGISGLRSDEMQRFTRTNAQGQFVIPRVPDRWLDSVAEIRARGVVGGEWVASRKTQFRVSRTSTGEIVLRLEPGVAASISGRVIDTATGQPLAHIPVRIFGFGNTAEISERAYTDASGRYQFPVLWPDLMYDLSTQPEGYGGQSIPRNPGNLQFRMGEVRKNQDFVLRPATRTLTGVVVTPAGKPLSGVTVSVSAGEGDFHGTGTDSSGRFRFEGLLDNELQMNVQPRFGTSAAFKQKVPAGETSMRIVVR